MALGLPIVGRCPQLSGTWCELVSSCFVNTVTWSLRLHRSMGSLMEPRKANQQFTSGKLYSQHALHVESANFYNDSYSCCGACSLSHTCIQCFCFIFPFLFIYHSFHIWPNWFSTFCSEWSSFNAAILVQKLFYICIKKKFIPSNKESLFALNHLIYIFSIYIYIWYT